MDVDEAVCGAGLVFAYALIGSVFGVVGVLSFSTIGWLLGALTVAVVVALLVPSAPHRRLRLHATSVEGSYLRETSRVLGRKISTVDLDQVAYAVWEHEPPMAVRPREYIGFYDQDPQLEMTILGSMPANRRAKQAGTLGLELLRGDIREELQRRVANGSLIATFDLATGKPLPGHLPPLQNGTEFTEDGCMVRRPSL